MARSRLTTVPRQRRRARRVKVRETRAGRRYACRCCGFLTLVEPPGNTYETCPVCRWDDDGLQVQNPDMTGGSNKVSFNEARHNFRHYRVSDPNRQPRARPPRPEERP